MMILHLFPVVFAGVLSERGSSLKTYPHFLFAFLEVLKKSRKTENRSKATRDLSYGVFVILPGVNFHPFCTQKEKPPNPNKLSDA